MRTKDRPILLQRALQSVCQQTLGDWSLAIVNDGGDPQPVDQLVAALPESHRQRITVLHHPESRGMEAASNAGLEALQSRYVLIHDDDDSLHPDFFARTSAYLDAPPHPSVKGVITHAFRIIERIEGDAVHHLQTHPYNTWVQTVSLRRMLVENFFAPIGFLFDRKACIEVGAFREDLPVLGDWDFNVRFLEAYEIGLIPECLANYHDRDQSADPEYTSSVSGKAHLHLFFDNLLRNEWLRKDIESGRTGKGLLANQAIMLRDLGWDLRQALRRKRWLSLFKFKR